MGLVMLSRARGDIGRTPLCVFELESFFDGFDEPISANAAGALIGEIDLARMCVRSTKYIGDKAAAPISPMARNRAAVVPWANIEPANERRKRLARERRKKHKEFREAIKIADAKAAAAAKAAERDQEARLFKEAFEEKARKDALDARLRAEKLEQAEREFSAFLEKGLAIAEANIGALVSEIKRFGPGVPVHLVIEPALVSLADGADHAGRCFVGNTPKEAKARVDALLAAIRGGAGRAPLALLPKE